MENRFDGTADFVVQAHTVRGDLVYAPTQVLPGSPVDDAARDLARLVGRQWRVEARLRGLFDPVPLPVPWLAERQGDLVEHVGLAGRAPTGDAAGLDDFVDQYLALPQRRLVVLGDAGSGKTTLAVLLVLALVARPAADAGPVPVLLSIGGWEPDREHLHGWLERRLRQDYPALRPAVARDLVAQQRILPVLDGLDELPAPLRPVALRELNKALAAGGPLVLTSRTDAYHDAVREAEVLRSAAVVRAATLTPATVAGYLATCATPRDAARWRPLLAELLDHPEGPVAQVLAAPLMVWLTRTVYGRHGTDPAGLADPHRFPDADAVRVHLLDALVPAVFHDDPAPPPATGLRSPPAWPARRARRWLGGLAAHLVREGSEDLAWWRLHRRLPVWARVAVVFPLAWVVSWLTFAVLLYPDARWALDSVLIAALVALFPTLATGSAAGGGAPADARTGPRYRVWRGRSATNRGEAKILLLVGLALWVGLALLHLVDALRGTTSWSELLVRVARLLPAMLLLTVVVGLVDFLREDRFHQDERASPDQALALGRRRATAAGLALAVATVVPFGLFLLWSDGGGWPWRLVVLFPVMASFVVVTAVLRTEWGAYVTARAILAACGRAPWRMSAFLAEAHRRGVLRQAGPVYQFRHAELRDRLGTRPGAAAPPTGSG